MSHSISSALAHGALDVCESLGDIEKLLLTRNYPLRENKRFTLRGIYDVEHDELLAGEAIRKSDGLTIVFFGHNYKIYHAKNKKKCIATLSFANNIWSGFIVDKKVTCQGTFSNPCGNLCATYEDVLNNYSKFLLHGPNCMRENHQLHERGDFVHGILVRGLKIETNGNVWDGSFNSANHIADGIYWNNTENLCYMGAFFNGLLHGDNCRIFKNRERTKLYAHGAFRNGEMIAGCVCTDDVTIIRGSFIGKFKPQGMCFVYNLQDGTVTESFFWDGIRLDLT